MEEKTMTVEEALKLVASTLGEINVPINLKRQIADPVSSCLDILNACLDSIANKESEDKPIDLGDMNEVLKEEDESDEADA